MRTSMKLAAVVLAIVVIATCGLLLRAGLGSAAATAPSPVPQDAVRGMEEQGIHVRLDEAGTRGHADEAERALAAAKASFAFLSDDGKAYASLGLVTMDDRKGITDRTLWIVYFEGVAQPAFGGEPNPDAGLSVMTILVDPETFRYVSATSY